MNLVISDTGPLLHLIEVGAAELLSHLGVIQTTPTVWSELLRHAPADVANEPPDWISVCTPSASALRQATQWVHAQVLHAGEAEALAFALESQADMFLTDDTAARTIGESLGLHVRGSLGVVLFAAAAGHLNQPTCLRVLDNLEHRSTLWMSANVRSAVRHAITQIFGSD